MVSFHFFFVGLDRARAAANLLSIMGIGAVVDSVIANGAVAALGGAAAP
jgi:hypothetical protein